MSIVPREVVDNLIMGSECRDPQDGMKLSQYKLADKLAQWALDQAAQLCDTQARLDYDAYDLTGNAYSEGAADAADGLATKIRALVKGGESDGQG
jgi:hypothetical protein